MGLLDVFKSSKAKVPEMPEFKDYRTDAQNVKNQTKNWGNYDPVKNGGFYDPNAINKYSNAESSAIDRLTGMAQNGGYTQEQKKSMYDGAMINVNNEADRMKEFAKNDNYARGLGQSSVLSRNYGEIDKGVLDQSRQISGSIESESSQMGMDAIGKIQQGEEIAQKYAMEASQYKHSLMSQLQMNENEMQMALNKINSTIDMDNAGRELEYTKIRNQFNLDTTQMQSMIAQAERDRKASFWANLAGGVMNAGITVASAGLFNSKDAGVEG